MVEITGKIIAGPDDLPWRIFEADAIGIADCREREELEFPGHCDHHVSVPQFRNNAARIAVSRYDRLRRERLPVQSSRGDRGEDIPDRRLRATQAVIRLS